MIRAEPKLRVRSRWVLPITREPLADGAVLVGGDGRIQAVGPNATVPDPAGVTRVELPDAILLPGLVNTHTHLELTGFDGLVGADDFFLWIQGLRHLKQQRSEAEYSEAARRGVRDCWRAGVTTIADTGDSGAVPKALAELGGSGICYQEVFGPDPRQCEASLAGLVRRLGELAVYAGPRVRLGISPHAAYSVSAPLFRAAAEYARRVRAPLAVHLAESTAESALVARGEGPFADFWRSRGLGIPYGGGVVTTPVELLEHEGVLGPDLLAIHCVQLSDQDLARMARYDVAVACCPRSNGRHGHGAPRVSEFRRAGIRVGAGTDSVASVAPLDLLAEVRAARILGALDPEEALELVTIGAARALGLDRELGALEPGLWGDLTAVRIPASSTHFPVDLVIASGISDIIATWVGGREVYRVNP